MRREDGDAVRSSRAPVQRPIVAGGRASLWSRHVPVLLVLPGVGFVVALLVLPFLSLVALSLLDWDLQRVSRTFVGLANYGAILRDGRLWESVGHTLLITAIAAPLELVLGLGLAQLISGQVRGRTWLVPLFVLPAIMSPIVVGYGWRMLWDTQYGPINHLLAAVLGRPVTIVWLAHPQTVYAALITTEVWQWTPFMFLALLAALASVDPELLEAASIDGASGWSAFWLVTLPLITPMMAVALVLRSLDLLKLFDTVFALTYGGPGTLTETLSLYVYILGFKNFRLGYTAAAAVLFLAGLSVLSTAIIRRMVEE